MRAWLWKVFPPFEVKLTIEEISSFLNEHASLCRDLILRDAVALARHAEKTVYSIRIEGMKPDRLALLVITNVLGSHISSGQNHIYRGTLSVVGADMLKVWSAAVASLKERGYYSDAKAEEDMQWIRQQIKNAG